MRVPDAASPKYPITLSWPNGDIDVCLTEPDLCRDVEWFDSDAKGYEGIATDATGRAVRLKLLGRRLITLGFLEP